jgi:uncharacterized protein (TIGR00251 family)
VQVNLRQDGDRVLIPVRAKPRSGRSAVAGVREDGALEVKLAAPPIEGAANEELVRFLAREVLGVAPSRVTLVLGEHGRDKLVAVTGLALDEVGARIRAHLPG